jgi:hypothetical protein
LETSGARKMPSFSKACHSFFSTFAAFDIL